MSLLLLLKEPGGHHYWLKIRVEEDGAMDRAGNGFDADPSTSQREGTIRCKIRFENDGLHVLEVFYE